MTNRLYVGNLSFQSTQDVLRDAFAACGQVVDVHLVADRMTGQSRGFGFVTMGSRAEAEHAIATMNGTELDGRSLRVNEAEERTDSRRAGGGSGDRGRKQRF
ncbi:MAG TPA: RNA-binding protein [Polyangiaceae bacterium]|nr:RNA-binding protein [Polyangiaceae bacterium]